MRNVTTFLIRAFGLRTLVLWVLVHVCLGVLTMAGRLPGSARISAGEAFLPSPGSAIPVALLTATLIVLDMRAMREPTFLANIGVSQVRVAAFAFMAAAFFEFLVGTATRL